MMAWFNGVGRAGRINGMMSKTPTKKAMAPAASLGSMEPDLFGGVEK
jgi:hypothetical protein